MPEDQPPTSIPEKPEPSLLDLLLKDLKPDKGEVLKKVRELVVDAKFQEAVAKARPILDSALTAFMSVRSELKKLKESPDVPGAKNASGAVIREPGFTDAALKKINETEQRLAKYIKLLNEALASGDFSKLGEIKGGKDAPAAD